MPTLHRLWPLLPLVLSACASHPAAYRAPQQEIRQELADARQPVPARPAQADPLAAALLPPLQLDPPKVSTQKPEPRFDLVVNNAPAAQVLLGIVAGTRYSMLLPPDLSGNITVNLKDVTVPEALAALKHLYGYEYRVEGSRIFVQAQALQTRILRVNYLNAQRRGTSDIRVISGSVTDTVGSGGEGGSGSGSSSGGDNSGSGGQSSATLENSRISTQSQSDFWSELALTLRAIVGEKEGRNVVVSPQSGVLVIRAMPSEMAQVEAYLKASQLAVERQVILEAKIIEVTLRNGFESGINWAAFGQRDNRAGSVGMVSPGVTLGRTGQLIGETIGGDPGLTLGNAADSLGTMFGLVFRTNNFAAVLSFLEQQGTVHVLSSPRIATVNNQKAVLKVGTDDFFVTGVSTSTTTSGSSTTSMPNVTLRPFFSGISLDVTPQIDENSNVILHIHPSVSKVRTVQQQINLGTLGNLSLPLASSEVSETDSIVRAQDGQIIALGGLIRQAASDNDSQVPVLGSIPVVGELFKQKGKSVEKRELVILLRPIVIQSDATWADEIGRADKRVNELLGDAPSGGAAR